MKCSGCGHENREGAKFCANATSCPKCGARSVKGQKDEENHERNR